MKPILYFIEYVVNNLFPLNEYSEGEIRYLMDKFKEEADDFNIEINDEELKFYIKRFDTLKNTPNIQEKDLRKWSLKQLIKLIKSKDVVPNSDKPEDQTPDVVYNEGDLIIYNGNKHKNCIEYGQNEKWCITRQTSNWSNYRYGVEEVTFYLVKDQSKLDSNKDSFFVIHVLNNGNYRWTDRSNNPGMSDVIPWNEIESRFPVLRGLRGVFKYQPISNKEKEENTKKISFRDWAINLDIGQKQKYIINIINNSPIYHRLELFDDISNSSFLQKVGNFDKIAKWISENPEILRDPFLLLSTFDSFKPYYQRSIVHNLRNKVGISLDSEAYPWSAKKELVKYDKITTNDKEFIYLYNEDTIVKLDFSNNKIKLSLYLEDIDYPNIKINNRTAKYIADFPKPELLPIDLILSTIQNNDLDPNLFKLNFDKGQKVTIDDKDVFFNWEKLIAFDAETKKIISLSNEAVRKEFVRESQTNMKLCDSIMNLLKQPGQHFENKGIKYNDLIPIVKNMIHKNGVINNIDFYVYADNDSISLLPVNLEDLHFRAMAYYNEIYPNGIEKKEFNNELSRDYVRFMNQTGKAFNSNQLLSIFHNNQGIPYQTKIDFINANPPRSQGNKYTPQIIKDTIFLINREVPENSKKVSKKTGGILKAKGRAVGTPIAGRGRGRPIATPAATPAAVMPQALAPIGQTIGAVLRGHDITDATNNNTLRTFFNQPAQRVDSDRGASKRQAALGNRGDITEIYKVGQSTCYIIRFNNGHKIASISLQPAALHFIAFEDRIDQIHRVGELAGVLGGLNLEEQKYIIKEFFMKKMNII